MKDALAVEQGIFDKWVEALSGPRVDPSTPLG